MSTWLKEEIEFICKNLEKDPKEVFKKFNKKMNPDRSYKSFIYQFNKQKNLQEPKFLTKEEIDGLLNAAEEHFQEKEKCDGSTECKVKKALEDVEKVIMSGKEEIKVISDKIQIEINNKIETIDLLEVKENLRSKLNLFKTKSKEILDNLEKQKNEMKPKIEDKIDEAIVYTGVLKYNIEEKFKKIEPELESVFNEIKIESSGVMDKISEESKSFLNNLKAKLEEFKPKEPETKKSNIDENVDDSIKDVEETNENKISLNPNGTKLKDYKDFILDQKEKGMKSKDVLSYLHANTNLSKDIDKSKIRKFINKNS